MKNKDDAVIVLLRAITIVCLGMGIGGLIAYMLFNLGLL